MRFNSPGYLLLLLLLPAIHYLHMNLLSRKTHGTLQYSSIEVLKQFKADWKAGFVQRAPIIRLFLLALIIIAIARPQTGHSYEEFLTEGIDLILAIDASGSMLAEDFAPKNRIDVAKEKVSEFIKGRKGDRIGLVIFGEESFTFCPMTLDYSFLQKRISDIHVGIVPEDKTAIGMALVTSLNRLRSSNAKSKVIILLTDGMNNTGKIDPLTAAQMAKALGVKIYTIGIGKNGLVRIPVKDQFGRKVYAQMKTEIDEDSLMKISEATHGQFFRATSEDSLKKIYQIIDGMEKTQVDIKLYSNYKEFFPYLLWPAFIGLMFERIAARTWLRVYP